MDTKKIRSKSLVLTAAGAVSAMGMAGAAQGAVLALWDVAHNGTNGTPVVGGVQNGGPATNVLTGVTAPNAAIGTQTGVYVNLFAGSGAYFGDGSNSASDEATILGANQYAKVSLTTTDASPSLNVSQIDFWARAHNGPGSYWVYAGPTGFTPTAGSFVQTGTIAVSSNANNVGYGYGWDNPVTSDATPPITVPLSTFNGLTGIDVYVYLQSGPTIRQTFGGAELEGTLASVPEPASLGLLGLGGLLMMRRRKA